jgi:3'(2'), 5'-bisphosphate nucleotidase
MGQAPEEKFLPTALALAEEASRAVLQCRNLPLEKERKADRSYVTVADRRSDEIIRKGLEKKFPDHAILTEEFGWIGKPASEYLWLVDPLDGTKAFAKNIPGFCVMIGLLRAGQPVLGVIVDPLEARVYQAIRGAGAYQHYQGKREALHVSTREHFPEMPLIISTGFPETALQNLLERLGSPLVPPINSVGIKVGLLLRQVGDIYLNHHAVHYWDTCAPQMLLEEAGGCFTKLDGSPLDYSQRKSFDHGGPTLATNGRRHGELVEIMKEFRLR